MAIRQSQEKKIKTKWREKIVKKTTKKSSIYVIDILTQRIKEQDLL